MSDEFGFEDDFEGDSDIDLTPLIDVVFLLIIFFVLATTFSKPVLDVVLPSSDTAQKEKFDKGEFLVEINSDGEIYNDKTLYTRMNIMELITKDTSNTMILHIDENSPFKSFLLIIDSAKKIDRKNIVVATDDKNE